MSAFHRRNRSRSVTRVVVAMTATAAIALSLGACSAGGSGGGGGDGEVTLNFAWWGDASRADRYERSIDLFEEQNPNVTVKTSYAGFADYWTARNTEAASRNLPDVIQMDIAYLTEYASFGHVAPLEDYFGDTIDVDTVAEPLLAAAAIDDKTYGVPTSSATLATVVNTELAAQLGAPALSDSPTWEEYDAFLAAVSKGGASASPAVAGSVDYTAIFTLFQIWLGQQGKTLFDGDGGLGFEKADLVEWWEKSVALKKAGAILSPERQAQIEGSDPLGIAETASEISWDNFLFRFSEGSAGATLDLLPVPTDDPEKSGMFLKPSLMLSLASNSENPEEATALIDFLLNDPEVGAIFGLTRGVPASSTARDAVEPGPLDTKIIEYEAALESRLTNTPPPPVAGFATLDQTFVSVGQDVTYGALSPSDAADKWLAEAETVLGD